MVELQRMGYEPSRLVAVVLSCFAAGCLAPAPSSWDEDGDGTTRLIDCDDTDPARAPTLPEICDGVDNDCLGLGGAGTDAVDSSCTVFEQRLLPCTQGVEVGVDLWRFGGPALVTVDTVSEGTAFDPVLFSFADGAADGEPSVLTDDDVPCSFAPPNGYACPRWSFASGLWVIGVAASVEVEPSCANEQLARYSIDFGGGHATLIADDLLLEAP